MNHEFLKRFDEDVAFAQLPRRERFLRRPFATGARFVFGRLFSRLEITVRIRAKLFWGDAMTVLFPEMVSSTILYQHFNEEMVTRFFLSAIEPGDTVLDVGGHFGYHALLASALAGETGHVHAFEPTPSVFVLLRENTVSKPNIHIEQTALWNRDEMMRLYDFGTLRSASNTLIASRNADAGRARQYGVQATTIDHYCGDTIAPALVKIDAEGAEEQIIQGAERTISRCRPAFVLEVGQAGIRDGESSPAVKLLRELRYEVGEFDGNDIVLVHPSWKRKT